MSALDGARLKLRRARGHINFFESETRKYLSAALEEAVEESRDGFVAVRSFRLKDPPKWLSVIIGDCLTNSRAALDYLVWELAGKYFAEKPDDSDRWIQFPISVKSLLDKRYLERGMPAGVLTAIEAIRPNNAGYEPLSWLGILVNADKHRTVVVTTGHLRSVCVNSPGGPGVRAKPIGGTAAVAWSGNRVQINLGPDKSEGIIVYGDSDAITVNGDIVVKFAHAGVPTEAVDVVLNQICDCVAGILEKFEPCLDP